MIHTSRLLHIVGNRLKEYETGGQRAGFLEVVLLSRCDIMVALDYWHSRWREIVGNFEWENVQEHRTSRIHL